MTLNQNTRHMPVVKFEQPPTDNIWILENDSIGTDTARIVPFIENYKDPNARFTFTFMDTHGFTVESDGKERHTSGFPRQPQEKGTPYSMKIEGATHCIIQDVSVSADTKTMVLVQHEGMGANASFQIHVKKSTKS